MAKTKKTAVRKKNLPTTKKKPAAKPKAVPKEAAKVDEDAVPCPRNFTCEEDVLICRAYVSTSEDPVKGNDQHAQVFWSGVQQKFTALYRKECEVEEEEGATRDSNAIKNRFQHHIGKDLQVWNHYYKQHKEQKPSGWTFPDYLQAASNTYLQVEGRPFKFGECVKILHKMPKFNPMIEDSDEEEEEGAPKTNQTGAAMGQGLPRPQGNKAAKKEVKEVASLQSIETQKIEAFQEMSQSTNKLATLIGRKERHETWLGMAKLNAELGDTEQAREYLAMIKANAEECQRKDAAEEAEEGKKLAAKPPSVVEITATTNTQSTDEGQVQEDQVMPPLPEQPEQPILAGESGSSLDGVQ